MDHNGYTYEIINDNEVRLTNLPSTFGDNDFIPKYAMYRDKRYTVTEIDFYFLVCYLKSLGNNNICHEKQKRDLSLFLDISILAFCACRQLSPK